MRMFASGGIGSAVGLPMRPMMALDDWTGDDMGVVATELAVSDVEGAEARAGVLPVIIGENDAEEAQLLNVLSIPSVASEGRLEGTDVIVIGVVMAIIVDGGEAELLLGTGTSAAAEVVVVVGVGVATGVVSVGGGDVTTGVFEGRTPGSCWPMPAGACETELIGSKVVEGVVVILGKLTSGTATWITGAASPLCVRTARESPPIREGARILAKVRGFGGQIWSGATVAVSIYQWRLMEEQVPGCDAKHC